MELKNVYKMQWLCVYFHAKLVKIHLQRAHHVKKEIIESLNQIAAHVLVDIKV